MNGTMPSLCARIINSENLLNRNTEKSKLLRHHQLKRGAQTREHNVCSGREHQRCAVGESIRGAQRERAS